MKRLLKTIWKQMTCKHEYWWDYQASSSSDNKDYELVEVGCRCVKCGKTKKIIFKEKKVM